MTESSILEEYLMLWGLEWPSSRFLIAENILFSSVPGNENQECLQYLAKHWSNRSKPVDSSSQALWPWWCQSSKAHVITNQLTYWFPWLCFHLLIFLNLSFYFEITEHWHVALRSNTKGSINLLPSVPMIMSLWTTEQFPTSILTQIQSRGRTFPSLGSFLGPFYSPPDSFPPLPSL